MSTVSNNQSGQKGRTSIRSGDGNNIFVPFSLNGRTASIAANKLPDSAWSHHGTNSIYSVDHKNDDGQDMVTLRIGRGKTFIQGLQAEVFGDMESLLKDYGYSSNRSN